jgi:hypothetical protein
MHVESAIQNTKAKDQQGKYKRKQIKTRSEKEKSMEDTYRRPMGKLKDAPPATCMQAMYGHPAALIDRPLIIGHYPFYY